MYLWRMKLHIYSSFLIFPKRIGKIQENSAFIGWRKDWSRILKQVLSIVMNRFLLCPLTKMYKELFSSFFESNYYVYTVDFLSPQMLYWSSLDFTQIPRNNQSGRFKPTFNNILSTNILNEKQWICSINFGIGILYFYRTKTTYFIFDFFD